MEASVDANLSLEELRCSISATEQAGSYFLTNMIKGDSKTQNNISFISAPLGQAIPDLAFAELLPNDSMDAVSSAQKDHGRNLIFCNAVYVDGKEVRLAAFR